MGNCVRSNIEHTPPVGRLQYQYRPPTEQVDTAVSAATSQQPDEQQQQDEGDQSLPWQQQEAMVQHIADREGVGSLCTCVFKYPCSV